MLDSAKKPWQSKTIVLNFLMAAGALFYAPMAEWIAGNPGAVASAWAVLGILLRLVSKDKISLSE